MTPALVLRAPASPTLQQVIGLLLAPFDLPQDALDRLSDLDERSLLYFHRPIPGSTETPYQKLSQSSSQVEGTDLPPTEEEVLAAMALRVGAWMRRLYPKNTAKLAARQLNVSHHTTRKVLKGKLPENRLLWAMVRAWGRPFADDLLEVALLAAEVDQSIRAARVRNARLETEIRGEINAASAGPAAGSPPGASVDLARGPCGTTTRRCKAAG